MKTSEFLRLVEANGWVVLRQKGSHVIYGKGKETMPVPNHGSKEIKKGLEQFLRKKMGLK